MPDNDLRASGAPTEPRPPADSGPAAMPHAQGSAGRAVVRGTSRLLVGLLAAKALDFALYLLLARRLGVSEFGRYVFALSFTLLFTIVADLGIGTVFTREVARLPGRARALLGHALAIKLALGAVALAASALVALAMHVAPRTQLLIALFTLALIANSAALLFEGLLKSRGRAGQAGVSVFLQSTAAFAVGASLVFGLGIGALGGTIAYLAASLVHVTGAAVLARDLWGAPAAAPGVGRAARGADAEVARDGGARADAARVRRERLALLRESAPIALSGVFIALYFRVDSVMLHALRGEHDTGLYGGIYRFFEASVLFSAAYRSVLFPILSRAADGPGDALRLLCRKSLRLHLLVTLAVATFVSFEARPIVALVLGPAYLDAARGLVFLMWALPGAFMADTLLHVLTAQGRQREGARAASLTALFNVALNLLLIPRLSFVGASIATAASEALCFALLFQQVRAGLPDLGLTRVAVRPLAAASALALGLALARPLLPAGPAGLALAAAAGATLYVATLALIGGLGRADVALLKAALPGAGRVAPRS